MCALVAAFLHFFFLSSFCWVLTEAWQSYMAVTGRLRNRIIRKRFLCLGWGECVCVVVFGECCMSCVMGCLTLSGFSLRSARFSRRHFCRLHQSQRLRHCQLVSISHLVRCLSFSFCLCLCEFNTGVSSSFSAAVGCLLKEVSCTHLWVQQLLSFW